MASIQQVKNPLKSYPYDPPNQTPKLLTKKNITAPIKAPKILNIIDLLKYLEIKPIKMILPDVNNIVE